MSQAPLDENLTGLEIAIIGMAGRFPGAQNIDQFWQNLRDGVEGISFFSPTDLNGSLGPNVADDPEYVKARGILADVEGFDAELFGFSPREAEITDPQHRIFLECAWEALEHAGYTPETFEGLIGMYAGLSMNTYLLQNLLTNQDVLHSTGSYQVMIRNDKDYLSTLVSYKLNLQGPSVVVQTACSTSLVAVHLACQGLLGGNCDMALAGGVSIVLPQKSGYRYQEGGIMSPDGHCRAFDAQARGTVAGNGVGIVVLKRLENALADNDSIHAIIKGSAINNDGGRKIGYTAPSVDGQAKAIRDAHLMAEVEPETISYVEAHGTGTPLGDPIEVAALTQAFRLGTHNTGYCALGSVKTNIGHLDAAAGIAGLIKTVLALKHGMVPPSLHFEQPNPAIDFANSPFYVNARLAEWARNGTPRRAGVSSFGIGGTNAHVILEEAPRVAPSGTGKPWQVLVLSAATSTALETITENLVRQIKHDPELPLADIAYTLQLGRKPLAYRRMLVCRDRDDALQALETRDPKRVFTTVQEPEHRSVAFMFPGQGAQYVYMTSEIYRHEPVFRAVVDDCCAFLKPHLGLDLRDVLYPAENNDSSVALLDQTWITQPTLFVIEYALARLWMSWGITPKALIGHSIGEYVAACLAGVFSLHDALMLVAARGKLIQQLPAGAMLSVPLSAAEIEPLLNDQLSLAAINAPALCVVAGTVEAIAQCEQSLLARGLQPRRLHTSHAFHSGMLEPILPSFRAYIEQLNLKPPQILYLSNVTGAWITAAEATSPEYWVKHLRQTVRFADNARALLRESSWMLLEVGPGRALTTLVNQQRAQSATQIAFPVLPTASDRQSDLAFLLQTLGYLWLNGSPVRWAEVHRHETRQRVPLPTYPFEHQRYWLDAQPQPDWSQHQGVEAERAVSIKTDVADWFYIPFWKPSVGLAPASSTTQHPIRWLVFSAEDGVSTQLAQRLAQAQHEVVIVRAGSCFARLSESEYTIRPHQRDDYDSLLADLKAASTLPERIIHAWGLTPDDQSRSALDRFEQTRSLGFSSLICLAQTLSSHDLTPLLWVMTNTIHALADEALLYPEKATLLGACTLIPQAYPDLICCSVDVALPAPGSWQEQMLLDQLMTELHMLPTEQAVAYRGYQRWIQRFEPVHLGQSSDALRPLRLHGVYLLIGGLDERGVALAEYLLRATHATVFFVEDGAFPSSDRWQHWLNTQHEDSPVSRKIRRVQQLERFAAQIRVIGADLTDIAQMQSVIAEIDRRAGGLHGVIYTAGEVSGHELIPFSEIDPAHDGLYLHRSAASLDVLSQILRGRQLDFCLLQSSSSAICSYAGAAAAVANTWFTAAFTQRHNQTSSTPWTTISWDRWHPEASVDDGTIRISPRQGVEAFRYIVGLGPIAHLIVSTEDVATRIKRRTRDSLLQPTKPAPRTSSAHLRPHLTTQYVAPGNALERTIVDIWQELLGIEPIGIYDNFFELGGHSLMATQLMARLRAMLQLEVPMRSIFEAATAADIALLLLQKQAEQIEEATLVEILADIRPQPVADVPLTDLSTAALASRIADLTLEERAVFVQRLDAYLAPGRNDRGQIIPRRHASDVLPLSFAQQRLWFLDQLNPGNPAYNIFASLRVTGGLDTDILAQSVTRIIERHEILRTTFVIEAGQPVQRIGPAQPLPIPIIDLENIPADDRAAAVTAHATVEGRRPFDLTQGPLLRIMLLRLAEHDYIFFLAMHHIISDAWSLGVFMRDLTAFYEASLSRQPAALPDLPIQYADFAVWQRAWLQGKTLETQLAYWKRQLAGAPPRLQLSVARPRPETPTSRGAVHVFTVPQPLSESLATLCQDQSITLFMLLTAAFNIVLHYYTRSEDLVIGTDVANRTETETEELIGFFVNQLVLRTDLSGNPAFTELLGRVRQICLDAYVHQHLPFEQIVEALNPERSLTVAPLFQVKLILQNTPTPPLKCADLILTPQESDFAPVQLDLIFSITETPQGLVGRMEYNADLFDAPTMTRIADHFELILRTVVVSPQRTLRELTAVLEDVDSRRLSIQEQQFAAASQQKLRHVRRKTVSVKQPKGENHE